MPVKTVAMHVERNSVKHVVDRLDNLNKMDEIKYSQNIVYIFSILVSRAVLNSKASTYEVILNINNNERRLGFHYLGNFRVVILIIFFIIIVTFFIHFS